MAPHKPTHRKRRTREHVIADLSVNHVERHALLCGFTVERVAHDYGLDLVITTYNHAGEVENGDIRVQLKATDRPRRVTGGDSIALRIEQEHFRHWLLEPMPVLLILYDASADLAHWLYVQAYFEKRRELEFEEARRKMTIRIPRANVVDSSAMKRFAEYRDRILAQMEGVTHYD